VIEFDAPGKRIEAFLMQDGKPVAYMSVSNILKKD